MPTPPPNQDSPEREQTDESLRTEREKTDHALAAKHDAAEDHADRIVRRARDKADAVLLDARDKADDRLGKGPSPAAALVEQRQLEDDAVDHERASADESLKRERAASARALASLLPLEREKTDRFLLTERGQSDEALAHRDDFLGLVSHDLRNLLGGVVVSVEVLAQRAEADTEGRQALVETTRIKRYVARMNRLIGDLLDVTSIDAGKLALAPEEGDFAALVAEALDTFDAPASAKGLALSAEAHAPTLPAVFDHDRMLQVLANLITNSIKFTDSGGRIVLRCAREGDALQFSIRDTGRGIPADMLEAVFERFWQAGANDRKGLGLGLYISKCIVEGHGGEIRAESPPGGGAIIRFTLPARGL